MRPASKLKAAHANYGNPSVYEFQMGGGKTGKGKTSGTAEKLITCLRWN